MKKSYSFLLTLLTLVFLNLHHSQAQTYVDIPDANFRYILKYLYPTCFNKSGQMDTLCSGVVNATALDVSNNYSISDLQGVQYFTKLVSLNCKNNRISYLPPLPATLTLLDCSMNQLWSLPKLPPNLTTLDCYGNNLTSLPPLPITLTWLDCSINQLWKLPNLPPNLTTLDCAVNQLTWLPNLPMSLKTLQCYGCLLASLPDLPGNLTDLVCSSNQLVSIPSLPASLTSLFCYGNQLVNLPNLPESLKYLHCHYNQLTSLPVLPAKLMSLKANYNCFTLPPTNPYPSTLTTFVVTPNSPNCIPTATESITSSTTLSLYPNPTEDKVSLTNAGEINKLELYNSYGQNVPVTLDKSTKEFSMEGLPSGIYTLSMVVDGKPVTIKVAKK